MMLRPLPTALAPVRAWAGHHVRAWAGHHAPAIAARKPPTPGVVPSRQRRRNLFALCSIALSACASAPSAPAPAPAPSDETPASVAASEAALPPPLLRGARCAGGAAKCTCRKPGDDAETDPPADGMKRLEVRLSFFGGKGALASPSLGRLPGADAAESCYYVDVPAGSTSNVRFFGQANDENTGFTPHLAIAEYGAKGPFWYEVLTVDCIGVGGRCDRAGSDAWVATLRQRKRGRIDPCGSFVVTGLNWDTSGGLAHRDNGFYRDFQVTFALEAKKFAPQFAPHSTECVPK